MLEALRGWRLGVLRQLVRLLAVIVAYVCAIFGGRVLLPVTRTVFKMPDALLSVIGGMVLAILCYAVITSIGIVLFRRTGQHESRIVRIVFGSGGALLGIFFGIFFVWMIVAGVRLVGSVAEAQARARSALTNATMQPVWNRPLQIKGKPRFSEDDSNALVITLARIKDSLESGRVGNAVKNLDPVPPTIYERLEKFGAVASNVESAERFLAFPGAREISEHPKIRALRNDPQIVDLIAHGRIFELLQNQRIIEAVNDPELRVRLQKFDIDRALDYALARDREMPKR